VAGGFYVAEAAGQPVTVRQPHHLSPPMTDPLFAARAIADADRARARSIAAADRALARARDRFLADRARARGDARASALAAADDEHGDTITTTPPHPIAQ